MTEGIKVVHALPGRVRVKVAQIKGNPELARQAREKLAGVPGIREVEANPLTGSVLVLFDLATMAAEAIEPLGAVLAEFLPEVEALSLISGLAALAAAPDAGAHPGGKLTGGLAALNAQVGRITGGLDLKLLAPLALLFLGARGLLAAKKTTFPTWYDYLWFGFSSLVMLNRGWFEGDKRELEPVPVTGEGKKEDLKEEKTPG
jgi:hypothetical protein